MQRRLIAAALSLACVALTGCDSGRTDPPNASVLVVHADPTLGSATFKRVEVNATPLEYKSSSVFSFDVDTYTFNFEISAPNGAVAQTISAERELLESMDYIIVLRNSAGQPTVRFIESPIAAGTGGAQLQLLHTAASVGAVDVFIELQGFDVLAATPRASLSNGEVLPPTVLATGTYELALTEANNPSNVLLRSAPFALGGAENLFLFIADSNGEGLAPFTVTFAQGEGTDLVDTSIESGIRVLNGIADRSAIDAGIDMQLSPPLIPNVAFGTVSDQFTAPTGERTLTITPAGNPGVIEVDQAFTANQDALNTAFIYGAPGSLQARLVADDFRVISGEAKLRVFNASALNANVDVFVLPAGTSPSTSNITFTVANGNATINRRLLPGDYELTVRTAGASTVLAGPTPITIAADSYYALLLADPGSGSGIDVLYLYDFN